MNLNAGYNWQLGRPVGGEAWLEGKTMLDLLASGIQEIFDPNDDEVLDNAKETSLNGLRKFRIKPSLSQKVENEHPFDGKNVYILCEDENGNIILGTDGEYFTKGRRQETEEWLVRFQRDHPEIKITFNVFLHAEGSLIKEAWERYGDLPLEERMKITLKWYTNYLPCGPYCHPNMEALLPPGLKVQVIKYWASIDIAYVLTYIGGSGQPHRHPPWYYNHNWNPQLPP